jgi:hypothetical protein
MIVYLIFYLIHYILCLSLGSKLETVPPCTERSYIAKPSPIKVISHNINGSGKLRGAVAQVYL